MPCRGRSICGRRRRSRCCGGSSRAHLSRSTARACCEWRRSCWTVPVLELRRRMGCQIAIAMIGEAEQRLLQFLRETADIRLFAAFAPTVESLEVQSFATEYRGHTQYYAWNTAFA